MTFSQCSIFSGVIRGLLTALLLAILEMVAPRAAFAQNFQRYTLEVRGAGDQSALLDGFMSLRRHASDNDIDEDELQRLVAAAPQQAKELLATEGYFGPVVTARRDGEANSRRVILDVELGPPTLIGEIEIRFAGAIADGDPAEQRRMERLRERWPIKRGERFRQASWDEAKSALLNNLLARDYPAATLAQSQARIDPAQRVADLSVEADSGPAFTFGALQVNGLKRYARSRIDALNPIMAGQPYSQNRLNELQARLQDSGYFKSVFATIDVDAAHSQNVPVRVDVSENERRRLALGGGFSTDSGARLQAKFLDREFLGHDWRLDSELRVDRTSRLLAGEVTGAALANGWMPGVSGRFERTDIAGEISDKLRLDVRATGPDKNNEPVLGAAYLIEREHAGDAASSNRHALIAVSQYTVRRIDSLFNPRRALVATGELDAGPRGFGNPANLLRVTGRVTWLQPLSRKWQTLVRLQLGQVIGAPRSTVPGDLLFRTGGDQTVRGYAYNSLGVNESDAIVGGRVLAVISGELVYQFTPQWGAAVFEDAGNAADRWADLRLRRGTGVGARWRSPIGPVNLDLAFAQQTRKPRLHFSIGYGF